MKINARKILFNHNLKFSKQREQVINELALLEQPISVEELYDNLKKQGNHMNLSTVYRTIDALHSHKIIEKVYSSLKNSHLIQLSHAHHQHYLVCIYCHAMIPIDYCPMEQLMDHIKDTYDFKVISHQLEISGVCHNCQP